eukprot:g20385.t1
MGTAVVKCLLALFLGAEARAAVGTPLAFVVPKVSRAPFLLRNRRQFAGVASTETARRVPAAARSAADAAHGRKWRQRWAAAVGVAAAWLWPKMAFARVAKRVVSRADERRAGLYTVAGNKRRICKNV